MVIVYVKMAIFNQIIDVFLVIQLKGNIFQNAIIKTVQTKFGLHQKTVMMAMI